MNAHSFPIRAQSYEDQLAQRIEEGRERAPASLARFIAKWEADTGLTFRDPEPTAEQIAEARAKADAAVLGLVDDLAPLGVPRVVLKERG